MANLARIRVEAGDDSFKVLLSRFRGAMKESGILQTYRQKQFYESPSRKKRRKSREAESARLKLKNKLKENFTRKNNHE